ncbi:PAS domain S-box protein [Bradyrhizobium sp. USDA 4353]
MDIGSTTDDLKRRLADAEATISSLHRLLLDSWVQATWETDAFGVVIADSPSWRAYTGQTLAEWLGYGWLDAIHPDDRPFAERQWREAMTACRVVDAEFRLRAPDGGWRWTNVRAAPVLDEHGSIEKWAGVNIDIDARKRVELALRESEERHSFLVRFSDAVRGLADPVAVATTACRMLLEQLKVDHAHWAEVDRATEEFVTVGAVHSPGVLPIEGRFSLKAWEPYSASHRSGRSVVVNDTQTDPRSDGSMRATAASMDIGADLATPVLVKGHLAGVLSVKRRQPHRWTSEEIALVECVAGRCGAEVERARVEAGLRASEDKYRTLFESIDEGFCVLEMMYDEGGAPRDCRYVQVNPAFLKQTGQKDPTGKLGSEYVPASAPLWLATYDAVVRSGEPVRFEQFHPDSGRWYSVYASIIGERGSRLVASVFADITQRKRAETSLRESEERQAFLLKLSDAVRPLADPADIQGETTRLLREQLNAGWCYYVDWDQDRKTGLVLRDSARDGLPSLRGAHDVSDAPEFFQILAKGAVLMVRDYASYEHLPTRIRENFTALGFRSMMLAPLLKEGKLIASLLVGDSEIREWSASEASLLIEVAERTWAAIERAHAETALRKSEERYRSLFETMDQGYSLNEVIRDAQGRAIDIRYLEHNPALERLTGVPASEAIGRLASEVFPGLDRFWIEVVDRVVTTGEREQVEHELSSNGRWYQSKFYAAGGDCCVSLFDDITERKKAEAVQRESEERQEFLLKFSDSLRAQPDIDAIAYRAVGLLSEQLGLDRCYITYYRPDQDEADFPYQVGNTTVPPLPPKVRLSDFPEAYEQVLQKTFVVEDDFERRGLSEAERANSKALGMRAMVASTIRKGERNPLSSMAAVSSRPRRWTAGEIALVEEAAERTWAAMEHARADEELRESESRFQQFADASSGVLWVRDAATLDMEYVSRGASTIYGVRPANLLGDISIWAALVVPDDREATLSHIERIRGGEIELHEFRIQRPSDQAFRWVRNTGFPLLDADGNVERIGGIFEDFTDAKLAVEHQAILLAELQHRVRNIMAVVRSIAARSGERAGSVIEYGELLAGRLLALSRVQTLLTRAANVRVNLRSIILDEVSIQAQHEGQYEVAGPDIEISPKAAEVLTLALHELSTNALKYGALSLSEGKVSIRWEIVDKNGTPWLSLDWMEMGAPAAPTTDNPRRRGFGSELIEGRIPYELKGRGRLVIGQGGAECHLEFPLKVGASILETGAPQRATVFGGALDMTGEPDLDGVSILVVEDDYYLATDATRALRGARAEVLGPCSSEEEAREELSKRRPHAVLLDINLGSGPTFKLAEQLKDNGVPFVFVTGYDQAVIPAEFDAISRLEKPIQLRRLAGAISKLLSDGRNPALKAAAEAPASQTAARANIDRFLDALDGENDGSILHRLILEEERKLARDAEHLDFAESRTARFRKRYDRLSSWRDGFAAGTAAREQADRVVASSLDTLQSMERFCRQLREGNFPV